MRILNRTAISKIATITLALVMVLASTLAAFTATQAGNGDASYAGPGKNTFAAGMDLTEVYLVGDKFDVNPDELEITDNTSGALAINGYKMTLLGSKLTQDTLDNNITGEYKATYKDAAILPDGTTRDVEVTFTIGRVLTAHTGNVDIPQATTIFNNTNATVDPTKHGINITSNLHLKTDDKSKTFGIAVEQTLTITVVGGSGDFVVPVNGINQNRNSAGSYKVIRSTFEEAGYNASIETVSVQNNDNTFYPSNNNTYISVDNGIFTERGGTAAQYDPSTYADNTPAGGGSGSDGNYTSGFATVGSNGIQLTVNEPCGANSTNNSPYSNNLYIVLGDLIHRIWSGSGDNGKIETFKKGDSGTVLPGGSFPGDDITTVTGDETTTKRYVVPDAKAGVKYVMTPNAEYFAKEVSVDGEVKKIPMDQQPGTEWKFAAGTLVQKENNVLEFTFDDPNAADHSIYVTWRTTPAGDDVTSIDGKGETQTGQPIFKPGGVPFLSTGGYKLMDGDTPVDEITVPGEGKYTIDPDTGIVTFVPEPDFVGTAKGVTVRATDEDGNKATAKYTPTVVQTDQTKTVTRKVKFTYKTKNGKTASKTVTQILTFKRSGKYNKETGQVDYPDWEPQTFPAVKAPKIKGWKPNMAKAPALTVTDPDQKIADVHIIYNKKGSSESTGVDTADHNNPLIWLCIMIAAMLSSTAVVYRRIKARN